MAEPWRTITGSLTKLNVAVLIVSIIAGLLVPAFFKPSIARADASCSPLGIQTDSAGNVYNGSYWLPSLGGGVNVCNNGSDPTVDAGGTTPQLRSCVWRCGGFPLSER